MPGKDVSVVNSEGQVGKLSADEAVTQIKLGNVRQAHPEEVKAEEKRIDAERAVEEKVRKYGGVGGALKTAAINAADTAAFGFGKGLAVKGAEFFGGKQAGRDVAEGIQSYDEANPNAAIAGQVAGLAIPIVGELAGGSSAAARAARALGAPGRAVGAVAGAAERGVAGLVGEGATSFLGRAAQKAIPMAARGAIEGGAFGAGQAYSEAALGDHELTAENLVGAIGHGALIGGAVGGSFGLGSAVGTAAREGLAAAASKVDLGGLAERKAFESLGAKMRDFAKLGKTAEMSETRAREIGRTLLDQGIVKGSDGIESIAQKAAAKTEELGSKLGKMVEDLDAKAAIKPSVDTIAKRASDEIVTRLEGMTGQGPLAGKVKSIVDDFVAKTEANPTFTNIRTQRKAIDDLINYNKLSDMGLSAELKGVRNIIEDEFTKAGEAASKELGGSFAAEYKATKKLYSQVKTAADIANGEVMKQAAAPSVGFRDLMTSGALGGGLTGIAGAMASRAIRERGDQMAASLLNSMAGVSRRVETDMSSSLEKFFSKSESKAAPVSTTKGESLKTSYQKRVAAVSEAASNPQRTVDRITRTLGTIADVAPKTATAIAATTQRATEFLMTKVPGNHVNTRSLTPHLEPVSVNDAEMSKFLRYDRAVTKPDSVFTDLQAGKLSREAVEAFRYNFPKRYEKIQSKAIQLLTEQKNKLPYAKRLQLGILLDIPSDASLDRGFISSMQATFAPNVPNSKPSGQQPAPHRPLHVANLVQTPMQLSEGRQ